MGSHKKMCCVRRVAVLEVMSAPIEAAPPSFVVEHRRRTVWSCIVSVLTCHACSLMYTRSALSSFSMRSRTRLPAKRSTQFDSYPHLARRLSSRSVNPHRVVCRLLLCLVSHGSTAWRRFKGDVQPSSILEWFMFFSTPAPTRTCKLRMSLSRRWFQ